MTSLYLKVIFFKHELGANNIAITTSGNTTDLQLFFEENCWLNDREHVDQVERLFIKTLATKAPFSTALTNSEITNIENNAGLSEFWHQGEQAVGFGVAYILDTIALSLLSDERWNCSRIKLELRRIDENDEVIDEIVEIIHASCSDHVQEHVNWI